MTNPIHQRPRVLRMASAVGAAVALACLPATVSAYEYDTVLEEMTLKVGEHEGISFYTGLKTAGRYQVLDHEDAFPVVRPSADDPSPVAAELGGVEPGFQTAWGSMDFLARFDDLIDVYWEFFISSRPHPSEMQGSQGFIYMRGLPGDQLAFLFDHVDVKAGQFEVNFGDHIFRRSDNARVLRNRLIGNAVVDPRSEEIGMEIITKPGLLNGLIGVTSGSPQGDHLRGRGTAVYGKLWVTPSEYARVSLSGYTVDHSDNGSGFPDGGTKNNFLSTSRSGQPYAGVLDDGNAVGHVLIGRGQKVTAAQADVTLVFGPLELYGNVGMGRDEDENGSGAGTPEDNWAYYTAEAVYQVTDNFYGAARLSGAEADKIDGKDSNGSVTRAQVGIGYWITRHMLAKVELVHQEYSDFDAGVSVSGVDAGRDPSFDGVITEVGFAF